MVGFAEIELGQSVKASCRVGQTEMDLKLMDSLALRLPNSAPYLCCQLIKNGGSCCRKFIWPLRFSLFLWQIRWRELQNPSNAGFTRIGSRPILLFMRERNRIRLTCSKRLCGGFGDLEGYFASPTSLVFLLESNVVCWTDLNLSQTWYSLQVQVDWVDWALIFRFAHYWIWRLRNDDLFSDDFTALSDPSKIGLIKKYILDFIDAKTPSNSSYTFHL